MDPVDDVVQPKCPNCGTVLHDAGHGLWCRGCRLVYLPNVNPPE
jgi:tRNA(Ile2) C34 agmatinyltransferase TiaS